jgi:hypothetical protein
MVIYLTDELFMINISNSNYDQVISVIVSTVEFSDMVLFNLMNVISISFHRLSHHVFSEDIEMHIFYSGLHISLGILFVFLTNLLFNKLQFTGIKLAIANHVSQKLNSLLYIIFE